LHGKFSSKENSFTNEFFKQLTPRITGSKKQSEERTSLFAVRVNAIVMLFC
jgi:hypothetical protein